MRVQPQIALREILQKWLTDPATGLAPYFAVDQNATMNPADQKWHVWLCRNWYGSYHPMWAMGRVEDDRIITDWPERVFVAADPQFFEKVKSYLSKRKREYSHKQLDIPITELDDKP